MNVILVEDSELIRSQLMRALAAEPRIRLVGVTGEEAQAVQMIVQNRPDAVLLDLSLSPGSGITVLERVREQQCGCRVLVLTNNTDAAVRERCQALGVSGFFDKCLEADQCLQMLRSWLPDLPSNEPSRLIALHDTGLLDAPEQEEFDAIAQLARELTDTPIALVSLVDEHRQWFLAHQGIDARETSRSIAFCAHAIQGRDCLEVCDPLSDPRFSDNPLVQGAPYIRYYAGIPLVVPSGEAIGTLCVLDTVNRSLTPGQMAALKTLAHSVVSEIELRRKMRALEQEVKRRIRAEQQIALLAMNDIMTGLPNRAALLDRLDHQVRQSERHSGTLAFLLVDLDRFKWINDALGHDVGDSALVEVAQRLKATLRDSDTVARLGGDEFAILLADIDSLDAAMAVAGKLNTALNAPAELKGCRLHLDASIGVALYPQHGVSPDLLMRHADLAMYQVKRTGGNAAQAFNPALEEKALHRMTLEGELREALRQVDIVAHYQPQVMLGRNAVCGVEALARWMHPRLGLLTPDRFIEVAEMRGIILQLGQRMLDLALGQLAQWDRAGLQVPRVCVNVSAMELREGYVELVDALLKCHQVAANRLELEITESALAVDRSSAVRILQSLRHMGVSIAVDDFGVGYSSLGQLRRMPIDTLKIDKCFVDEVTDNDHDAAIVSAVTTMARSLGLRTIAEGTEDPQQLDVLRRLGCDGAQGNIWSRPLPPTEFSRWLQDFLRGAGEREEVLSAPP